MTSAADTHAAARPGPRRRALRTPWSLSVTRAGALVAIVALALGAISARSANPWLLLVACGLAAPVGVSLLLRPDGYHVELGYPTRATAGRRCEHVLVVRNDGRRSVPGARVTQRMRGFEDVAVAVPPLPPGAAAHLTVHRTALSRGPTSESAFTVRTGAPFGLTDRSVTTRGPVTLLVRPAVTQPASLVTSGDGERPSGRPARTGPELHGLREFRHGDDQRHVHWRGTARHGQLVVVVPEDTRDPRLALVVAGSPADEGWEPLLAVAAWTCVDALRRGHVVRVAAGGQPELVSSDADAVLDWFALLGDVPPPGPATLAEAAGWAGGDGVVAVAATAPGLVTGDVVRLAPDGTVTR